MSNKPYYIIYTDGSCYRGQGGYGVYIQYRTKDKILQETEISCGFENTTISRMEMMAVIVGLMEIKEKQRIPILIVSDSQFIINSIRNEWVFRWEKEGWKDRSNSDLWQILLEEWRQFSPDRIRFRHTRGHEKGLQCYREGNSRADSLCHYKNFIGRYEKDYSDEQWARIQGIDFEADPLNDLPF